MPDTLFRSGIFTIIGGIEKEISRVLLMYRFPFVFCTLPSHLRKKVNFGLLGRKDLESIVKGDDDRQRCRSPQELDIDCLTQPPPALVSCDTQKCTDMIVERPAKVHTEA